MKPPGASLTGRQKRTLANLEDYHRALAAKIETEKIDLAIPKTTVVDDHPGGRAGQGSGPAQQAA